MNLPIEKRALDILKEYNGINDYILNLQKQYFTSKTYIPTKKQSEYIISFHKVTPVILDRYVYIHKSCRQFVKEQLKLEEQPEKIYVNKLLSRKDDFLHLWGSFGEGNKKYQMIFLSKECLKKIKQIPDIDFSKYERDPKPHQIHAIKKLLENEHYILADQMGLGKTTSSIIAALEGDFKKILVVCPASLKLNWKKEIMNYDNVNNISIVDSGDFLVKKWTIINYDILKNFHTLPEKGIDRIISPIDFHKFDLVIADECFPYKTLVDTNIGKLEIGEIVEKSLNVNILSYNINSGSLEYKPIKRWIKKENGTILKITLQNELFIECTPNHKVYVKNKGYVTADNININDELFTMSEFVNKKTNLEEGKILLKELQFTLSKPKRCGLVNNCKRNPFKDDKRGCNKNLRILQRGIQDKGRNQTILQSELFSILENESTGNKKESTQLIRNRKNKNIKYKKLQRKSKSGVNIIETDETLEPNEQSVFNREDEKFIKRSNILSSWWERKNNNTGAKNVQPFGRSLEITSPNQNCGCKREFQISTTIISSGLRERRFKNRNRGGWENTSNQKMEIFGQKKNGSVGSIRVENIEILESGSGRSDRKLFDGDKRVYNIEVIDNHNYFADTILVSNCHYLKGSTAIRSKLFGDFVQRIPNRWFLTGTPITSKPIDFYNILHWCGSPIASNWMHFVRRYCAGRQMPIAKGSKKKFWITNGASNLEELREYCGDVMLRRTKEDSLDLPQKTIKPIYLPLELSTSYNLYISEYEEWAKISEESAEPPKVAEHLTKLTKVRQLLSNDKIKHTIAQAEELIENGHKVIIFSCFTSTINDIHEHFGKSSVIIDGSVSQKNRDIAVERFQNDNKIKVFCGNIIAAGVGLTLTEGSVVIFNDLDWVPANHAQAEDRAHRIGQNKPVHIIYPLFDDTLDTIMYETLQKKMKMISQILGDKPIDFDDISVGKEVISALKR